MQNGKQECHIVRTVLTNSYRNVETGKMDTSKSHMHDCSYSRLGADTSTKSDGIALVVWTDAYPHIEIMYCYFPFQ